MAQTDSDKIIHLFRKIWGYEDFRYPQEEIIHSLLAQRDALIIMPTGGGKSLCFQLPALLQPGLTIVISPLIALIENQVKELKEKKISAALLHHQLSKQERKKILFQLKQQKLKLLYLSPETLFSPPFWSTLSQENINISSLIIDEAHCLVEWGANFRPEYRRLGTIRKALLINQPNPKINIAAFTATANPSSQKDIIKTLKLDNPDLFIFNPYRENLELKVEWIWTGKCRRDRLLNFLSNQKKKSGLIYVRSRRCSEELAKYLINFGYATAPYHAGLPTENKRKIETDWLEDNLQFVVCTSAFGMGINKADVRWIIQYQPPIFLSEYLQEIGRAGRDGKKSQILTLISEPTGIFNSEDRQIEHFFQQKLQQQWQQVLGNLKKIPVSGTVESINKKFTDGDLILSLLHSADLLKWTDPFTYYLDRSIILSKNTSSLGKLQHSSQQMKQYLFTKDCRWHFLLNAFGFASKIKKCGHCDLCQ